MHKKLIISALLALAFSCTSANADTTTYTGTMDELRSKASTVMPTLGHYSLTTEKGTNTRSIVINGTTYYYTPSEDSQEKLNMLDYLAGSSTVALQTGSSTNYVFNVGSTYYTFDTTKLPQSAYTLTEKATPEHWGMTLPTWNETTQQYEDKTYDLVLRDQGTGTESFYYKWDTSGTDRKLTMDGATSGDNVLVAKHNASSHERITSGSGGDVTDDFFDLNNSSGKGGAIYLALGDLGNITGDFINNYASSSGGAIYNQKNIYSITGDFINNYASSGGAISNTNGTIGSITGDFINNYTSSYGGAIYNYGNTIISSIGSITGDFINNYAYSSGSSTVQGGAIYNQRNIYSITGDFIGNYAKTTSTTGYVNGGAIYNEATIGSITGDFINNYASGSTSNYIYGGAIYNTNGTIGSITGNFINNYASNTNSADGGAIYKDWGSIGSITGDFINNYAYGTYVNGGAIYNGGGSITTLTGNFINNYAYGSSYAFGGAIYNMKFINNITGNFIGNYAKTTSTTYNPYGGAIYNGIKNSYNSYVPDYDSNAKITLGNTTFTGNYTQKGSNTPVPNSIYNAGDITIADGATVTINDGYDGLGEAQLNVGTGSTFNLSVDNGIIQTDNLGIVTNNGTINWDLDVDLNPESTPETPKFDQISFTSLDGSKQSIIINAINLKTDKLGETTIQLVIAEQAEYYELSDAIESHITSPNGYTYDVSYYSSGSNAGKLEFNGTPVGPGGINDYVKENDDGSIQVTDDYIFTTDETWFAVSDDKDRTFKNTHKDDGSATTIDGASKTLTAESNAKGMIIAGAGEKTTNLLIKNLTFEGFTTDDNDGVLTILAGNHLTVKNITIRNNASGKWGVINHGTFNSDPSHYSAQVFNDGTATFENDEFLEITTGSAIKNTGTATLQLSTTEPTTPTQFHDNSGATYGGAIYNHKDSSPAGYPSLEASGVLFGKSGHGNTATDAGGAIWNNGVATITTSSFTDNSVTGTNSKGGAIYNAGTLTLTNTNFTGNTSAGLGGAIYSTVGFAINATSNPVVFADNKAGATLVANDIYMDGSAETDPIVLALNSGSSTNTITLNGGVTGTNYNVDVNNGTEGTVTIKGLSGAETIALKGGKLVLSTSDVSATTLTAAGMTELDTSSTNGLSVGTLTVANDAGFTNTGKLTVTNTLTNGTADHEGTIYNDGSLTLTGANMTNIGTITATDTSTPGSLNITGTSSDGAKLTNSGTITSNVTINMYATLSTSANGVVDANGIDNAGTLNLTAGNLASVINGIGVTNISGAVVTNGHNITQTTVNVGSDGTTNVEATLTNANTITSAVNVTTLGEFVNNGTVSGDLTNAHLVDNRAGTAITGNIVNKTGAGIKTLGGNIATGVSSTISNAGEIELFGGTLAKDISGYDSQYGTLTISDSSAVSSTATVSELKVLAGKTLTNSGIINVKDTLSMGVLAPSTLATITNTGTLNLLGGTSATTTMKNAGTINGGNINIGSYTSSTDYDTAYVENTGEGSMTGQIAIAQGSQLITSASKISDTDHNIANSGTLTITGGDLDDVITGGMVEVKAGSTGTISINASHGGIAIKSR